MKCRCGVEGKVWVVSEALIDYPGKVGKVEPPEWLCLKCAPKVERVQYQVPLPITGYALPSE